MAYVIWETVEGGSGQRHVIQGSTLHQSCIVSNLPGPYSDTEALLSAAVAAVSAITGDVGTALSVSGGGTAFLESFNPKVVDPSTVRVDITYRGFPVVQVEMNTTLCSVESDFDKDGVTHNLSHVPPGKRADQNSWVRGLRITQHCQFQADTPEDTVRIKFLITEDYPTDANLGITTESEDTPADRVRKFRQAYANKVNENAIVGGPLDGGARCWRLDQVRAVSRDGGKTYETECEFHHREIPSDASDLDVGGWDIPQAWTYPDTGKPPTGLLTAPAWWSGPTTDLFPDPLETGEGKERIFIRKYKETTFPNLPGLA